MSIMSHKGYSARIEFDERDNILVGRLLGVRDSVGFHADNVTDLRSAFEESVDDYIEACAKIGKTPEKPASGKLMLRVAPEVHQRALIAARGKGVSLNQWASEVLSAAAHG